MRVVVKNYLKEKRKKIVKKDTQSKQHEQKKTSQIFKYVQNSHKTMKNKNEKYCYTVKQLKCSGNTYGFQSSLEK